jgi:hypothetical protein
VYVRSTNRKFVQLLLEVPLPIMVMTTHELTTNDYLLMRLAVRFWPMVLTWRAAVNQSLVDCGMCAG